MAPAALGAPAQQAELPHPPGPPHLPLPVRGTALPGLQLRLASTPELGLQMATDDPPQLMLLDIQLPGMDGFELLERLRADPRTRHVPAVAVSADAMPDSIARGRAAGFDDYLTKPVDLDRLIAAVHTALAPA